jgi:hypothetical protein
MVDELPTTPPTKRYVYEYTQLPDDDMGIVVRELDAFGADGWHVVWVDLGGGFYRVLLEKEL